VIERAEQGADPAAATENGAVGAPGAPRSVVPTGSPERASPAPGPPPPPVPRGAPAPSTGSTGGDLPAHPGADVPLGRQLAAGAAPDSRSSAWMWLLFAALGFLGGQVMAAIYVAVTAGVDGKLGSLTTIAKLNEPPTWYIVSTLLGLWSGFFGAAWLATGVRGTKSFVRDLGLRFRWIDLVGVPIGVGGQIAVAVMYIPISHHVHNFSQRFNAPGQRLTGGSHGVGYAVIAVLTVVGAPFFEELFFRGVLLRALARLFGTVGGWVGPALAICVSGVLFGLAHAESLQLLGLAVFGVVLSLVSYRTGRLGMNMVAHATFNLMAVVAVVVPLALGGQALV
jgi:membrane protease YdiL (CAAX protease family)